MVAKNPKTKKKKSKTKEVKKRLGIPEKTLVQKVLEERNLSGFMKSEDAQLEGTIVRETPAGIVRIEGEITPEKLERAKEFERIFMASSQEIMDLAAYTPNPMVMEFLKTSKITQGEVALIKAGKPWDLFMIAGQWFMITPDHKLENVKNYCFRLERALLDWMKKAKDSDEKAANLTKLVYDLEEKLEDKRIEREVNGEDLDDRPNPFILLFKNTYAKIRELIYRFLGENNG